MNEHNKTENVECVRSTGDIYFKIGKPFPNSTFVVAVVVGAVRQVLVVPLSWLWMKKRRSRDDEDEEENK